MTLRFVSPMLSLFAVPAIVGIVAVTQLVSLDGLLQKSAGLPIVIQPQNAPEKLIQSTVSSEPYTTTIAVQTEQERYNTTLSQIQDGDWLTHQGKFQAAKAAYHEAISQTQNADLAATATDRLHQLSRQLALKPVVKPIVKPVIKLAIKPVIKLAVKPVVKLAVKPVVKSESKFAVGREVKSVVKPVKESPRNFIPESVANSIAESTANPIADPIANSTASDLLPIPQPTSPAVSQLGQSPSPETLLPAQTIGVESPQWNPESSGQLN